MPVEDLFLAGIPRLARDQPDRKRISTLATEVCLYHPYCILQQISGRIMQNDAAAFHDINNCLLISLLQHVTITARACCNR
jgi:hypothetical protein